METKTLVEKKKQFPLEVTARSLRRYTRLLHKLDVVYMD